MKVLVKVYDKVKYEKGSTKITECEYDIDSYEVKEISDKEIYNLGFDDVDKYGEYLILTLKDGEKATFRNSLVDLFLKRI
jgi:hypothetical protein